MTLVDGQRGQNRKYALVKGPFELGARARIELVVAPHANSLARERGPQLVVHQVRETVEGNAQAGRDRG